MEFGLVHSDTCIERIIRLIVLCILLLFGVKVTRESDKVICNTPFLKKVNKQIYISIVYKMVCVCMCYTYTIIIYPGIFFR